jgi:hypothetical protein
MLKFILSVLLMTNIAAAKEFHHGPEPRPRPEPTEPPRPLPPGAMWVCYSYDADGVQYWGKDYLQSSAEDLAIYACDHYSQAQGCYLYSCVEGY